MINLLPQLPLRRRRRLAKDLLLLLSLFISLSLSPFLSSHSSLYLLLLRYVNNFASVCGDQLLKCASERGREMERDCLRGHISWA